MPAALRECLNDLSLVNGYGNRWLYVFSYADNLLPEGGVVNEAAPAEGGRCDPQRPHAARMVGRVERTEAAKELWACVYPELRREHDGVVGSMLARAAPQTLRLSLIYALIDGSDVIDEQHLRAALAFWIQRPHRGAPVRQPRRIQREPEDPLRSARRGPEDADGHLSDVLQQPFRCPHRRRARRAATRAGGGETTREAARGCPIERWAATDNATDGST